LITEPDAGHVQRAPGPVDLGYRLPLGMPRGRTVGHVVSVITETIETYLDGALPFGENRSYSNSGVLTVKGDQPSTVEDLDITLADRLHVGSRWI
jgi:hypothetical protein